MKLSWLLPASLLAACGTGSPASPTMGDGGGTDAVAPATDGGGQEAAAEAGASDAGETGAPVTVTFSYEPQWGGVKKVEVVGGFGMATDWSKSQSLITLTASGGVYSGTATLPPGIYLYLFRVTGDAQGPTPATYERYALDPLETAYASCPAASPSYSKVDVNPCSQITVTATGGPSQATPVHVKGKLTVDGGAAAGWMAVLEREEPKSHHYFVNRVTTGSDGSFDVVGSAGSYRLQIQYPTLLSANDLERSPTALAALRRAISAAFPLASSAVTVTVPDLAFHSYGVYAPTGDGGALPTSFTFESGIEAKLDVYGGPGDGGVVEIGDPWYASATANDGGAVFGGDFNTPQATEDAAAPATRYLWGTEQPTGADAGLTWTLQTMVFPITWP
ncbi:MAG TPA: glycogen-binding domain-containing protein [Polyangiaceae bacterium]|jgi:hypothetical protein